MFWLVMFPCPLPVAESFLPSLSLRSNNRTPTPARASRRAHSMPDAPPPTTIAVSVLALLFILSPPAASRLRTPQTIFPLQKVLLVRKRPRHAEPIRTAADAAYFLGTIFSLPPMYGRSTSGMLTLPSSFKWFSSKAMSMRGGATTVLLRVCAKAFPFSVL